MQSMFPRLVRKMFGLPLKFVRRALQLWTPSQPEILPVGGLTPEASSELLFALRQAATTAEVSKKMGKATASHSALRMLACTGPNDEREMHGATVCAG